jgi:hypothetical protein
MGRRLEPLKYYWFSKGLKLSDSSANYGVNYLMY